MEEKSMLYGLILLLYGLFPLEAHDWAKTCQEALERFHPAGLRSTGLRPSSKEGLLKESGTKKGQRPPKGTKGCLVDESCNGDFVSSGDFSPQDEKTSVEQTGSHEMAAAREHEVLVFVSFSMPEASLKALFDAAAQHKAVLVMRGLYEDSFVKTAEKLQNMGVVADINPELFDTYGIEHVPVFVRLQHGKEVARLSGNVSLDFALSKLEDVS
jgi:type-F conjugative transfer system pilin assembly protein TrbC